MRMNSRLFPFDPNKEAHLLNPIVLAYAGDAVFELYVRQYLISQPNHRPQHLHKRATQYVSAKAQSKALQIWLPQLNEEELNIVKRGRNAKSGSSPKNADVLEYRHSTAFEALIGYLYFKEQYDRLNELMKAAIEQSE